MRTYAFVDVETTGFSPDKDSIIEVAVALWQDGAVVDEFSALVNPDRPLPYEITQLTGITDNMLATAKRMPALRGGLARMIGDATVVGHNVNFDLGFLNAERLANGNPQLDTLTLATIAWPNLGRHGLAYLQRHFNLAPHATNHRALDDVHITVALFELLQETIGGWDFALLEEIVTAGRGLHWPETAFFEDALADRVRAAFGDSPPRLARLGRLFNVPVPDGRPLVPEEDAPDPIDVALVSSLLQPGSNFSRIFEAFEHRPQQIMMTEAVAEAFNSGEHLLVEAGTGTGKSLAYLVPAAFWAVHNQRRVVISTNTINLQDQLLGKDIPALQRGLPFEVRAAVRKGRRNYVCTRLFQQMRHRGPKNRDEMALYARLLVWLQQTETGDINELNIRGRGERIALSRLTADTGNCRAMECSAERCPLHVTKRRAELAHIVIVNHALLLSDVANQNHILPAFRDLIVDEAHHFELAVTNGLSFSADKRFLEAVIDEVINPKGLVGDLERRARNELPPMPASNFVSAAEKLRDIGNLAAIRLEEFFETLRYFLRDHVSRRTEFSQQIRLLPHVRHNAEWEEVMLSWDNLRQPLSRIATGLGKLGRGVGEAIDLYDWAETEDLQATLAGNATDLEKTVDALTEIVAKPDESMIYWIDVWRDRLSLHAAPLHIGPLVEEHIFHQLDTVVMTSATLRTAPQGRYTAANFDYLRNRLHAGHAAELAVGSPFDYRRSTLVYLASDIAEPKQPGYQRQVEEAVTNLALALGGRTLVLFTSYRQLRETAEAIQPALFEHGISILAQYEGTSRRQLLAQFTQPDARAVLLGTKSFWEGVDVAGPALEAVVLVKLPFDVPSDPIFAARSETFDNSFFEYAIPEAVLRFRQGFGRLIRRSTDEGIVLVLDKRVLTKRYGELFLNALPECTMLRQRIDRIPEIVQRWHDRDRAAM